MNEGYPADGTTPQNQIKDTLGQILTDMSKLRAELRERHDELRSIFQLLLPARPRHLVRALDNHEPVMLQDNVVSGDRVQRQCSPAGGGESGCHNTAEIGRGIPQSIILRATLSTSMLYIGGALDPRRDMAGWSSLESSCWVDRFIIHVPTLNPAGQHLRRINVGEAHEPHRINISWKDADTTLNGWTPRLCFFVWEEAGPGRVMVSAAHATNPWRWKLELGRHVGTRPEDAGWIETMTFWVPEW